MRTLIVKFTQNSSGATAIEYALIAGLISVVIVGAAASLGTSLSARFGSVGNSLS